MELPRILIDFSGVHKFEKPDDDQTLKYNSFALFVLLMFEKFKTGASSSSGKWLTVVSTATWVRIPVTGELTFRHRQRQRTDTWQHVTNLNHFCGARIPLYNSKKKDVWEFSLCLIWCDWWGLHFSTSSIPAMCWRNNMSSIIEYKLGQIQKNPLQFWLFLPCFTGSWFFWYCIAVLYYLQWHPSLHPYVIKWKPSVLMYTMD